MTEEVKEHQTRLYIIFGIGLVLAICKVVSAPQFTISETLVFMLFLCGTMYTNYCLLVFFIIMALYSEVVYLMEFGKLAQIKIVTGNNPFSNIEGVKIFFYVVLATTVIFNAIAIYFTFLAYKVFKYEAFKGSIGGVQGRRADGQDEEARNNRNQGSNRQVFQGQGIVL